MSGTGTRLERNLKAWLRKMEIHIPERMAANGITFETSGIPFVG
jgi:hypothetical protein